MATQNTDVLVIGAGPVGLSLATELGMHGLNVIVAERNERVGHAPRAKTTNVRTRTFFRRWGIAQALADASPLGVDYPYNVHFVTRLAGYSLARIENGFNAAPVRRPEYPEHAQWIPQYRLEAVLREHVEKLPSVDLRFGLTFREAHEEGDGVTALLTDAAGDQISIAARYLIGADGARSAVRELIGATMDGAYGLSRNYNVVFRAPGLQELHNQGPGVMYWQVNSDGASLIGPMDRDDVWYFMPTGMKAGETISDAEAAARIAKSTGIDMPYEILSTDEWVASRLIADTYRSGRIFLAGDACHLHPPFGGYGMNMGISDAVDLGWKIAASLQGWGGPKLLDSYELERRPVHEKVMDEAVVNHSVLGNQLWRDGLEDDTPAGAAMRKQVGELIVAVKTREFRSLATVLGLRYEASPIILDDHSPPREQVGQDYRPDGHPGCLAPHAWTADGRSLYDLFGLGFALVVAEGAEDEAEKAVADGRRFGTPITLVKPAGVPVRDLYGASLALVRPDQHVAWRGEQWDPAVIRVAAGFGSNEELNAMSVPEAERLRVSAGARRLGS